MSTISSSTTSTTAYKVTADTTGTLVIQTGATPTTAVTVDASQNVGIGTSSPTQKLDVRGQGYFQSTSADAVVEVNSSGGSGRSYQIRSQSTGQFYVYDNTAGSARMVIDSSGNVGIGTSSPGYKLDVQSSASSGAPLMANFQSAGGDPQLYISNGTVKTQLTADATNSASIVGSFSNHPLIIRTNNTERARFDTSGNLLVGTTSSGGRFTVKSAGNTSATNTLSITNSSGTTLFYIRDDGAFQTGSASASPYNLTTGSAANVYVDNTGFLYRSTSSLKYKKNVHDATHGLADLLKLRSVTYEGKAEADVGKTFGGLIAEEVDAAGLTEFVQYAEDGTPDALAYGNMVSLCIKAIQEQQALIQQLQADVAALKGV